jgi:gliding motility-associatede transport system auxiliary component
MKRYDRRKLAYGGLALGVVLFLALNVFSETAFRNAEIDVTENRLFTVSQGTRDVLRSVKEPVTLRLFVSKRLLEVSPGLRNFVDRVEELLERYVALSDGGLRLEIINPEPFSPEEDRAVGFNIQGIPLDQTGELGYFGLVGTNTTDDVDVIPFVSPQREKFLEYDLTRLINNLANPKKKVIGLISSLPIDADPLKQYKPWRVVELLRQFFELRSMGLEPEIKDDVDLLMIVHPFGLSDKALYAIDQFVMKGGRAIVFVDPFAEEGSRSNAAMRLPPDIGSDLPKLFKAWGIEYDKDKVLGDRVLAQRVSAGNDGFGRPIITDYLAWLTFKKDRLDAADVITGELQAINVASAGYIAKAEDAEIGFEPLITSTKLAAGFDAAMVRRQPDPQAILAAFKPGNKPLVLAARITGTLKSAFPDGPPKDPKDEADEKAADNADDAKTETPPVVHLSESKTPVNLIVVADTDILADSFWLRQQDFFGQKLVVPIASNGDLVTNAVDNLSGTSAMIALRSRAGSARPFTRVEQIQNAAEEKFRAEEQALANRLKEIESKLEDLQTKEQGGKTAILSAEQRKAIESFRQEMVTTRQSLRRVQHALRKDIEELDARLTVINIAAMPLAVLVIAVALAVIRRRRADRRHRMTG